jgi:DNA-binding NarL/FixJ family response regulator
MSIEVLICEDHSFLRAGIRSLLADESDIAILEEPGFDRRALGRIIRRPSNVVLTGTLSKAIEIVRELKKSLPLLNGARVGVIALVSREEEVEVVAALLAGVRGVVRQDGQPVDLIHTIRAVAAGDAALSPTATKRLLDWASVTSPPPVPPPAAVGSLTGTELRILLQIADGVPGSEIAAKLGVSNATVRSHVHHILTKLGLHSRSEAVAFAYRHRIVGFQPFDRQPVGSPENGRIAG